MAAKVSRNCWLLLCAILVAIPLAALASPSDCPSCLAGQCNFSYTKCGQCPATFVTIGGPVNVLCSCCDSHSIACVTYYSPLGPQITNYSGTAQEYSLVQTGQGANCTAGVSCYTCWGYSYGSGSGGGCC